MERAAKACETELRGSEDDPSRDVIANDVNAMKRLVLALLSASDEGIVRVALGVMDGLKTALRSPREADDDVRREICVVVLFVPICVPIFFEGFMSLHIAFSLGLQGKLCLFTQMVAVAVVEGA